MNCPYCDESISLAAKFCPKCGLPLKEDATLMGAAFGSGEGPNRWLIGAGAAAIVAVALSIGWISTHGGQSSSTVTRREAVGAAGFPQPGAVAPYPARSTFTMAYAAPVSRPSGFSVPSAFNVGTSFTPARTLPAASAWTAPAPLRIARPAAAMPAEAPVAPPVDITVDRNRWREPSQVTTHVIIKPEVAAAPQPVYQEVTPGQGPALKPVVVRGDDTDQWVYDPVQDAWARVPRRSSTMGRGAITQSYPPGTPGLARVSPSNSPQPGLYGNPITSSSGPQPALSGNPIISSFGPQ